MCRRGEHFQDCCTMDVWLIFVIVCTSVQILVCWQLSYFLWDKGSWKQWSISSADKHLRLCSLQADCRQLSESSLFPLLPLRVDIPKGSANKHENLVCPISCGKIDALLRCLEGHSTCFGLTAFSSSVPSPVLCLPSVLALQLSWKPLWWQPASCECHIVLPIWTWAWPVFRKEENAELLSGSSAQALPGGLGVPVQRSLWATAFCSRRMWVVVFIYTYPCVGGGSACLSWLKKLIVTPSLVLLLWGFTWDFLWFI